MKKSKWFDGAKFVPAHDGVYETKHGMCHWNGKFWGMTCVTVAAAHFWDCRQSVCQSPTWRGIKK